MIPKSTIWAEIREKYIAPLLNYSIPLDKANYWNIRNILLSEPLALEFQEGDVLLTLRKEIFLKAQLGEIELSLNRATLQLISCINASKVKSGICCSWRFISYYYLNYFSAIVFLRQFQSGVIFIDPKYSELLSNFCTALSGSLVNIRPGTYEISTVDSGDEDEVKIKMDLRGGNAHEIVWRLLFKYMGAFLQNKRPLDDEGKYYQSYFKRDSDTGNALFPSKIRNLINYRLEYGYRELLDDTHDLTLKLSKPQTKIEYIIEFEKLSVNNSDRLEDQKYWISLMGINLYLLSTEIYLEYIARATNSYKNWLNARIRFLNRNISDRPNLSSWFILDGV